jgi:ATP-dependent Clp protease ATP-binding subunit ClpB
MFRSLGRTEIREIVEIQFRRLAKIAERNHNLTLDLSEAAKDWLADRGYDPAFGARPLKRVMQRNVSNALAEELLGGWIQDGDTVRIDLADDESGLTFETVKAEEAVTEPTGPTGDGAPPVEA